MGGGGGGGWEKVEVRKKKNMESRTEGKIKDGGGWEKNQ